MKQGGKVHNVYIISQNIEINPNKYTEMIQIPVQNIAEFAQSFLHYGRKDTTWPQ
jgi:hypothetical protein